MIAPTDYQEHSLDALRDYLRLTAQTGDPAGAFGVITRRQFQEAVKYLSVSVAGLGSRMPYACLRVPTGGEKTLPNSPTVTAAANAAIMTR